jgi:anti-sigma-K factor RskA
MTHEQLIESAASYALDALDPAERTAFEAHLAGCEECQDAVAAYREVAGALAHAAAPATPPNHAALRERIMREARAVRPLGIVTRRSPDASTPAVPASVNTVVLASRRRPIPWAVAVTSLAAALAFGFIYNAERERRTAVESELSALRAAKAEDDSLLAAFVGPMVHVVSLSEADQKPSVRVFWNHTRKQFIVTAFGLPPAPAGKTYQLWALRKGQAPLSMGTFAVNATGRTMTTLAVSADINDGGFIDDCALTLEPDGGSPEPTETPRLVGSWRHVD